MATLYVSILKKKIIIIANNSWNLYNFRLELINALVKDFDILICCEKDSYSKYLEKYNFSINDLKIKSSKYNFLIDIFNILKLLKIIFYYKPTHILSFTIKPNLYANLLNLFFNFKVVSNVTGLGSVYLSKNIVNKIIFSLNKFLLRRSYHVFFQNSSDQKVIFGDEKIFINSSVIAGSGINLSYFHFNKVSKINNYFLFIGRIIVDKGFVEFVEAIKKIKFYHKLEINFKVAGKLDFNNPSKICKVDFENWQKLNLFEYLGYVENNVEIINNSLCVILPSYREGLSRVLLESMALARPIITTNVPGCKELIENNQNGLLVAPKNAEDLANKIIQLNSLPLKKKIDMGLNSRKIVQKYDIKKVISQYKSIINQ